MAELNIDEKVSFINSRFEGCGITSSILQRIYRVHQIKKKRVQVRKGNSTKYPQERLETLTVQTLESVKKLIEEGYAIF